MWTIRQSPNQVLSRSHERVSVVQPKGLLRGKRLILGVTGSIAAYKAVSLLRTLKEHGAVVSVVMTNSAT
ncbi:MAG: hypothetical protein OEY86_14490, partial [Nitrospira sp.]|nr:hypothetical protein [Nitrospira sp.]